MRENYAKERKNLIYHLNPQIFPQFPVCECHVIAGRPCSPALNFHNDSPGSTGLGNTSLSIPITESVLFSHKLNESGQSCRYRN